MTNRNWGGRRVQAFSRYVCARDGYRCHFEGCMTLATTADHWPTPRDQLPFALWFEESLVLAACKHHNYSAGASYGNAKRANGSRVVYLGPSREW